MLELLIIMKALSGEPKTHSPRTPAPEVVPATTDAPSWNTDRGDIEYFPLPPSS